MHHTYDPERIVAPSRRQVNDLNVRLTVDCLFHEGSLLGCDLNREAWAEVQKVLGSSRSAVTTLLTDLVRPPHIQCRVSWFCEGGEGVLPVVHLW